MSAGPDQSWSLDLPQLTQSGADELVTFAKDTGICELASAVNPSLFLTLHLDRASVSALVELLANRPGGNNNDDELVLQGLAEDFGEWLEAAD